MMLRRTILRVYTYIYERSAKKRKKSARFSVLRKEKFRRDLFTESIGNFPKLDISIFDLFLQNKTKHVETIANYRVKYEKNFMNVNVNRLLDDS